MAHSPRPPPWPRNFNLSPLLGGLSSRLFVSRGHSFVSSLILGVVSGVLLVMLSVVFCDASLSDSCTRVYVSLVHSGVQILRLAVAVAVPLGAAKQRLIFSLRVDYGSDPRGSAYRLPPARLLTSHATRAAGTRPSSACLEPLRRPLAVTAG